MRVLVLGIGNVMFADEGIGVHFVNLMAKNYKFTSSKNELTLMDGGTLALALTHIISEFDYLIVVDCISANGASVGDVYFFDFLKCLKRIIHPILQGIQHCDTLLEHRRHLQVSLTFFGTSWHRLRL